MTVIDVDTDPDRNYASRFHLVMEVPSASDRGSPLAHKIAFYRTHPYNHFIILFEQERVSVEVHRRRDGGEWFKEEFTGADDVLELEGIGEVCTVADVYEDTRFDPRFFVGFQGPR